MGCVCAVWGVLVWTGCVFGICVVSTCVVCMFTVVNTVESVCVCVCNNVDVFYSMHGVCEHCVYVECVVYVCGSM